MLNKQYVCSVCGKLGHNKRTCGKTVPTRPPVHPHRPPQPELDTGAGVGEAGTLADAIRILGGDPQTVEPSAVLSNPTPVTVVEEPLTATQEPVVETMTAEDIEAWWMLTSGKTGKREIEEKDFHGWKYRQAVSNWTETDTDNLSAMLNVAVEQGTSARALKKFLNFFGAAAKKSLAKDERTKTAVLLILAKDSSVSVRKMLAERDTLPLPIMTVLSSDQNYETRLALAKRTDVEKTVLTKMHQEYETRPKLAANKRRTTSNSLRHVIARNPNLSISLRQEMLNSTDALEVYSALGNPATTAEEISQVWKKHRQNTRGYVFTGIINNPNTPAEVLDDFLNDNLFASSQPKYANRYVSSACAHPNASPAMLDKVIRHIVSNPELKIYSTNVPYSIANSRKTSEETLNWMIHQEALSPGVKYAAKDNLRSRPATTSQ